MNSIAARVAFKSWKAVAEIEQYADFSQIRYAQCWEDATVLVDALAVCPGQTVLSIASAGDNTLALLAQAPKKVIAVDLSVPQIACLALRVAAYRQLDYPELLDFIGSRPTDANPEIGQLRRQYYRRCRGLLTAEVQAFWDDRSHLIEQGIGAIGKFERYLDDFRRFVLPLIHDQSTIQTLLTLKSVNARQQFYDEQWDTWRWRLLFNLFFSRQVMGLLGRDPSFFRHVEGSVARIILQRVKRGLIHPDPSQNPYLQWIATGHHGSALPYALQPENVERIRNHLDKLEWHCTSLESYLSRSPDRAIDHFNLSNIFEWMSVDHYHALLPQLLRVGRSGGRLVYWNLLVDRQRPLHLATQLRPLTELAHQLEQHNQVFFYKRLVIEEIQ